MHVARLTQLDRRASRSRSTRLGPTMDGRDAGTSHLFYVDHPDRFNAALEEFLAKVPDRE